MKNRSRRQNINRPRPRHGHNKLNIKSVSVWWLLSVLSNILSSIHEIGKQHWGWVEKSFLFKNKCICILCNREQRIIIRKQVYSGEEKVFERELANNHRRNYMLTW